MTHVWLLLEAPDFEQCLSRAMLTRGLPRYRRGFLKHEGRASRGPAFVGIKYYKLWRLLSTKPLKIKEFLSVNY
jgi:hypothetical protein